MGEGGSAVETGRPLLGFRPKESRASLASALRPSISSWTRTHEFVYVLLRARNYGDRARRSSFSFFFVIHRKCSSSHVLLDPLLHVPLQLGSMLDIRRVRRVILPTVVEDELSISEEVVERRVKVRVELDLHRREVWR